MSIIDTSETLMDDIKRRDEQRVLYQANLAHAAGFIAGLARRIASWRLADGSLENFDAASDCEAIAARLRKLVGVTSGKGD